MSKLGLAAMCVQAISVILLIFTRLRRRSRSVTETPRLDDIDERLFELRVRPLWKRLLCSPIQVIRLRRHGIGWVSSLMLVMVALRAGMPYGIARRDDD